MPIFHPLDWFAQKWQEQIDKQVESDHALVVLIDKNEREMLEMRQKTSASVELAKKLEEEEREEERKKEEQIRADEKFARSLM